MSRGFPFSCFCYLCSSFIFYFFFYNLLSLFMIIFILSLFFFVVEYLEVKVFGIIGD